MVGARAYRALLRHAQRVLPEHNRVLFGVELQRLARAGAVNADVAARIAALLETTELRRGLLASAGHGVERDSKVQVAATANAVGLQVPDADALRAQHDQLARFDVAGVGPLWVDDTGVERRTPSA